MREKPSERTREREPEREREKERKGEGSEGGTIVSAKDGDEACQLA